MWVGCKLNPDGDALVVRRASFSASEGTGRSGAKRRQERRDRASERKAAEAVPEAMPMWNQ
jgi:hypothetical protein